VTIQLEVLLLAVLHIEDSKVGVGVAVVPDAQLLDLVRVVLAAVAGRARQLGVVVVLCGDAALGSVGGAESRALGEGGVGVGGVGDCVVGGGVEYELVGPVGRLVFEDVGRDLVGRGAVLGGCWGSGGGGEEGEGAHDQSGGDGAEDGHGSGGGEVSVFVLRE